MLKIDKQIIADRISTLTQALYACRKRQEHNTCAKLLDAIDLNIELLKNNHQEPLKI